MLGKQGGFTLIELVVVILILGILAATALPRFMSAQVDARVAKAQGLYGGIRSAAALAKARCELDIGRGLNTGNTCGASPSVVDMDGAIVSMANKYPDRSATGIIRAAQLSAANDGVTITYGATSADATTIDIVGATTAANCRISYKEATATAAAEISLVTTDCS